MVDLRNSRVLVTGGAGFIGSHLVETLAEVAKRTTVYDNLDDLYPKHENLHSLQGREGVSLIQSSILEYEKLYDAMKDIEIVFHLAAQCGMRYCVLSPMKAHEVNVRGTLNVLTAAKAQGVKRLIYASSSSVMGRPVALPMNEEHPTKPTNPYAATKLAGEAYSLMFHESYGLEACSLRYFNVYGPRSRPDQLITAIARSAVRGDELIVYGGGQSRDFTHVTDVVAATIRAAEIPEANGQVFNIGTGEDTEISSFVDHLYHLFQDHVKLDHRPIIRKELPSYESLATRADVSKARKVLGWEPKVSLEEGLSSYVEWVIRNKHRLSHSLS